MNQNQPLPDFLIVGAMKSGTSTLYYNLAGHPNIIPAKKKEIHYFDEKFHKGLSWYKSKFPLLSNPREDCITGEASPYYMFHPHAPRRIRETLPQAKIIVILRNPVDRAYSQYHHFYAQKRIKVSFEKAMQIEKNRIHREKRKMINNEKFHSGFYRMRSYLSRGIYVDQLQEFNYFYKKNQILTLKSEDFFANPQNTLGQIHQFLNLPDHKFKGFKVRNKPRYSPMHPSTRKELVEFYKPHNERLYKFLGKDFGWDS